MNDKKYAELIIKEALAVQKRENPIIWINANTENLPFARELTKMAYECGAAEVKVNIVDEVLSRLNMEGMSEERLAHFGEYKLDERMDYIKDGVAFISITGSNPDLFKGIDPKRLQIRNRASSKVMKPAMKYTMNDINSWTVVGYPTKAWAKNVFPDLDEDKAFERLKTEIFKTVRLDHEDPVAAWEEHLDKLAKRGEVLNNLQLKELHYKTDRGTDFRIGLPENHIWVGAESKDDRGYRFLPNLPTEEIFTAPDNRVAEGIVYATKPLNLSGSLVEDFWIRFEGGKAVEVGAKKGEDQLKELISRDEGACRLGEVALVSVKSPINTSGLIFYNTLFDENASCHLALGAAYPTCVEGGVDMDDEELKKHGINDSQIHDDFMIGDETLSIVGIDKDGKEHQIFKNGDFVI
ncbi:aminopeptidase [uncultured Ezakiella sp.]|uniref:aminopeptidase n=1 Tax=uncultured Ezakiella sp. TaxID=1637529 RepID=UPI0025CD251B|nr:aminopeptidase [uncultured Ezakiella sp.]